MSTIEWRYSQELCLKAIADYDKETAIPWRALVKMFCGTGKSMLEMYCGTEYDNALTVFIFPTISLITQFHIDYIFSDAWKSNMKNKRLLSICSKNELKRCDQKKIKYTTDTTDISVFLSKTSKKIVTVTYASFTRFFNIIFKTNTTINMAIYDEAHHIVGATIYKHLNNKKYNKLVEKKSIFYRYACE